MEAKSHELMCSGTNLSGVVVKVSGDPAHVVGEGGQNILAIVSPSRVLVPLFIPVVTEEEYRTACTGLVPGGAWA